MSGAQGQFKGLKLPQDLPRAHRQVLEELQNFCRSVSPQWDLSQSENLQSHIPQDGAVSSPGFQGKSNQLPPSPHGTTTLFDFPETTELEPSDLLRIAGAYRALPLDGITLRSDGTRYWEVGRFSPRMEISGEHWGITAGSGNDMTGAFQKAVSDPALAGRILRISGSGEILFSDTVEITQSNFGIYLDPGIVIKQQSALAVFSIHGEALAIATDLNADAFPGDFELTVVSNANFNVGDWIEVVDDRVPATGTADHKELHRIKYKTGGTIIGLYYPMLDSYFTSDNGYINKIAPIQDTWIMGQGALTNPSILEDEGKVLRLEHAVRCGIRDIEIFEMGLEAIGFITCALCSVIGVRIHDANQFWAVGDIVFPTGGYLTDDHGAGYGITTNSTHTCVIANNIIERTRHAIDISFFSQNISVTGNSISGCGSTAIQTHPDVRNISVVGNTVVGAVGHISDTAGGAGIEYSSIVEGTGIGVREHAVNVVIMGNTVCSVYGSGISAHGDDSENVIIAHNTIDNPNLDGNAVHAGIRALGTDLDNDLPGLIITGNSIRDESNLSETGILVGYNYATVSNNTIDGFQEGIMVASRINFRTVQDVRLLDNDIANCTFGIFLGGKTASGGVLGGRQVVRTLIRGNRIHACTLSGIYHVNGSSGSASDDDYSTGGIVEGNIIFSCNGDNNANHGGIWLVDTVAVTNDQFRYTVRNNYTKDNNTCGINVCGNGSIIEGNECDTEIARGIYINPISGTATGIIVRNNNCHHCTNEGIRMDATLEDCVVSGNMCWENDDDGIGIRTGCTECYVVRNQCYNNDDSGILIIGVNARVFENECYDTGAGTQGTQITLNASSTGTVFRNNWCEGGTVAYAINVACRFYDTAGAVLDVSDTSPTIKLTERTVRYITLTAARAPILPAANVVGHEVWVEDSTGNATGAITITPTAGAGDTFDDTGAAAGPPITTPYGALHIRCVASGRWKVL